LHKLLKTLLHYPNHGPRHQLYGVATFAWRENADLDKVLKLTLVSKRVFDASFKRMAIDLSYVRGSVKEVADELGIDPGRLSKWRQQHSTLEKTPIGLTMTRKKLEGCQRS
jgi:hypothetical protein